MQKSLPVVIFAAALIGGVSGQAIGYAIWHPSPPSAVDVAIQENQKAVLQNMEITATNLRANEAWCKTAQSWIAQAEKLKGI